MAALIAYKCSHISNAVRRNYLTLLLVRRCTTAQKEKKGIVLGIFETDNDVDGIAFTPSAENFNQRTSGKLSELLHLSGQTLKKGKSRLFYGIDKEYTSVAVVGLGKQSAGVNELEEINESKENIRTAAAVGARQLRDIGIKDIEIDPSTDAQAAGEGASLGLFAYDELKQESKRKPHVNLSLHGNQDSLDQWQKGILLGDCQNFARKLMEMPANKLTPVEFANQVVSKMTDLDHVQTTIRNKQWIEEKKMFSFLSVAQGSNQPPVFLEIQYSGCSNKDSPPLVLVGKGVTFDCGGISIKPAAQMDMMRGDMGGAAVVVAALLAIATLKIPINVVCLTPLCENLINGEAVKPGDVVTAMNGKSIQVDNTDAEGRLLLADALHYGCTSFHPTAIINAATLTGAMAVALGSAATGVFTNSRKLWTNLYMAGIETGDRLWRMPLFEHYTKQITDSQLADLNNIGKAARDGGACTAAAFLKEFVTCSHWAHLDIAGVMTNKDEVPYIGKGMSGRPTRTLVEYASRIADDIC
ncbi:cytosol aminopeptidase-like [Ptychodera flava]|uniref:cytosol aminopeptidase-like n=1 Tax=Ptychodera flava TaxID=63121 RepID=UPI00396A4AC4